MSSKKCCLRQHIRGEPTNLTLIDLSLTDTVLKYVLWGPNLQCSHVDEAFELFDIHEARPNSGSLAILHTQNGFALLEALSDDVSVESLGRNFDGASAHTGVKVRPSDLANLPSCLQLLPGQSFYLGKTTLTLVPEEHSDLQIISSDLPDSNLESYNYQVSQIRTPQKTTRMGTAVMETPMPHGDYESQTNTPILEQVTGQVISGRQDSTKWRGSPLKREVMRAVRDASKHGHSSSQPEFEKADQHMVDTAINEPDCSSSQPEVKTEDKDMATARAARPMEQDVVDLEDAEMAGAELRTEYLEKSEPLSSARAQQQPQGEIGGSRRSGILEESKTLSSSRARMQPKRGPEASDQSPILQASSESSPQSDDDLDDAPARKKVKTAAVVHNASVEESQDSLLDEVISVKREMPASTDQPVSAEQTSPTFPTTSINTESHSLSANQPKQRSPTLQTGSKQLSPAIDSDKRPLAAKQPPSESSFSSRRPNPQTPHSDWKTSSAPPSNSMEANSSMRSTRSTARDEHNRSSSADTQIRILFASSSSAGDSKPFLKFLSSKGVKKVQSVHDCTVLCVGKELKKTSKLILAVLLGKDVITDDWVTDSVNGNDLLSVVPYLAQDPEKEAEWGMSLDQAIYRGKQGLKVFQDQTIIFTPSAKKELGKNGFDELSEIVKCAGAKSVSSAIPKKSPEETTSTIVIATHDSTDMAKLHKLGWRAYVKDLISLSVLRGKLDLESEGFLIKEQKKESKKRKR